MPTRTAARNVYDPRVRELIRATRNPGLFPELGIPRSTAAGWLRGNFKPAVGTQALSNSEVELHARLAKAERRGRGFSSPACVRALGQSRSATRHDLRAISFPHRTGAVDAPRQNAKSRRTSEAHLPSSQCSRGS
jgi:hypothetical protein